MTLWHVQKLYMEDGSKFVVLPYEFGQNLTIENSYNYTNGSDEQADALAIVADEVICVNLKLLGYQDTLLVDSRVKDESGNYEQTKQYFYIYIGKSQVLILNKSNITEGSADELAEIFRSLGKRFREKKNLRTKPPRAD